MRRFVFTALLALLLAAPAEAVATPIARPIVYSKVNWEWVRVDEAHQVIVERGGLFAIRAGKPRQLTDVPGDSQPSVAADGGTVVFVRSGDLYAMGADGSDLRRLTGGPEVDEHPLIAPGGGYALFTRRPDRQALGGLYTVPLNGDTARALTTWSGEDREASFSPEGRAIVFVRSLPEASGGTNDELYSIRPSGEGLARLTDSPQDELHPRYFARGIVFDRRTLAGQGPSAVFTMRRDGRGVRVAATADRGASVAAVSPNGRLLLFNRARDGVWAKRLMSSGERWSRSTRLIDSNSDNLIFSPDGRRVAGTFFRPGGWGCCSVLASIDVHTGRSRGEGELWEPEPPGPTHTSIGFTIAW